MDFYYQIKGQGDSAFGGNWCWPPIFSGMVTADNKKKAKSLIEDDYGRKFPLRVLSKDLDKESYLLSIREIQHGDTRTKDLFLLKECKQCNIKFRVIDKYNDHNERNKGAEFCSDNCASKNRDENRIKTGPIESLSGGAAYIYKITNKLTSMVYIGKTTQIFTLRWYQHFYQGGDCKFHGAIKSSNFLDWDFTLIELVKTIKEVPIREQYWINHFNSIENGYNSVSATTKCNGE